MEITRSGGTTVPYMKWPTRSAKLLSWKLSARFGTRIYTNFTDLKLLNHRTEFCSGLHAVDAVDILQLMKTLYSDADGISQFINLIETAQRKSKRAKIEFQDKYMQGVALKSLLKSGDLKT